jgi:hypothetical protein
MSNGTCRPHLCGTNAISVGVAVTMTGQAKLSTPNLAWPAHPEEGTDAEFLRNGVSLTCGCNTI